MKGRKPVPAEVRLMQGGDVRHEEAPLPVLIGGRPIAEEFVAPAHIVGVARQWWDETIPILLSVNLLDRADRIELEMLATAYAQWRGCLLLLSSQGPFQTNKSGELKDAPWVRGLERWALMYDRLAEKYGLNPVARTRLGLAALQSKSLMDEMNERIGAVPETIEGHATEIADDDVGLPGG